jgi:hypothetical protein
MIFHKKEEKKKNHVTLQENGFADRLTSLTSLGNTHNIFSSENHDSMKHNLKIITVIHDELK